MKQFKMAVFAILAIFFLTTVNAQTKKEGTANHEHTMVYKCPMKCEGAKTYTQQGKCPKCNMNFKKVKTKNV